MNYYKNRLDYMKTQLKKYKNKIKIIIFNKGKPFRSCKEQNIIQDYKTIL